MRSRSRRRLSVLALTGALLLPAIPALAAETSGAGVALVPENQVVDDDLYAGALSVIVDGTVTGDLVAAAAERVVIDGEVVGSVTALAPEVIVRGRVGGSVRVASGTLVILGEVAKDVVTSSWRVEFGPESTVGGEVLFWSRRAVFTGAVERLVHGSASRIDMAGSVGGRVEVSTGRLVVTGPLTISGDLAYRSGREAEGLDQAEVGGTVVRRAELPANIRVRALVLLARMLAILFVAIAAVTVVWCWPDNTRRAARKARSPRSWLAGSAWFLSPLLVLGVGWAVLRFAPAAASLPLIAVLLPVLLALLGALAMASILAAIPVATAVGSAVFRRLGVNGATLGGALVLGAAWMLPWVGWLVPVVSIPLGLGAWMSSWSQREVEAA